MAGSVCWAASVTVTCETTECGTHVPAQRPSCSDVSASGASPDENDVTTVPESIRLPQSSTTSASIAAGQDAGVEKPAPNCVETGSNCVGVQPATGPGALACGAPPDGADPTTTASTAMRLMLASSANSSLTSPR